MRRFALLLLALLITAAPASAQAPDELLIEPEGGDPVTLAISALGEPDVVARPYLLPGAPAPVPITGYSLDLVLKAANVDPFAFGELSIQATSGAVVVSRDEATGRTTFPEGPPVFYLENGDARFLRPAGPAGEPAELAAGGPMTVGIAALEALSVSAKASPRKVKVGEPVRFTATVSGAATGETVEINWTFDDGRSGRGREVTHRFRKPGSYDVVVGATTEDDERGADDIVSVRVGNAPEGPDRKGGGTNPDSTAPDSGAGTGTGGTPAAPVAPVTPAAPVTPVTPSSPSTGFEPVEEPPPPTPTPPEPTPSPAEETGAETDGLEPVEGIELADLAALQSQAGQEAVEAARRGREQEEEGESGASAVWWVLAIGGLLGLGGLLEVSRRPGRRAT